jgi:hypothetical protein
MKTNLLDKFMWLVLIAAGIVVVAMWYQIVKWIF